MRVLADRLRKLRKMRRETQAETAQAVNVTRATYSRYENCQREPDLLTLIQLTNHFNVTSDYLLGLEDTFRDPLQHPNSDTHPENWYVSESDMSLLYKIRDLDEPKKSAIETLLK